jgi:hypothetical protein
MNKSASEWSSIDWALTHQIVLKYQTLIYSASANQNMPLVRTFQNRLLRSRYARLLAVRKVTQDNRGKKTAGVDGIKSLSPAERFNLANNLKITGKSKPVRRVYIPKPGTDEKRPLGIPTMIYWTNRLTKSPGLTASRLKLLKKQKYKCNYCQEFFFYGDIIEIDHIIPLIKGDSKNDANLQLLHGHCHDLKTKSDSFVESVIYESSTAKDIQTE